MINSPLFLLEKTHHGDTYPAMTPVNVTVRISSFKFDPGKAGGPDGLPT